MCRKIIVLFVVMTVFSAVVLSGLPEPRKCCGPNEIWTECGSNCPPRCKTRFPPRYECTKICVRGCECMEGYMRNPEGKCVLPCDCPVIETD